MKDSVSRHRNVQPTRRSSRLKFLREVYESDVKREDGSSDIQKHVNNADPGLTKQIKIEMVKMKMKQFHANQANKTRLFLMVPLMIKLAFL